MTATATTVCKTVVKLACLGGLFTLAFIYDGTLLYIFAAVTGGVLGYDLASFLPRKSGK